MKWFCSRKLDVSKRVFFFTNCDEMQNFMKSKNGVLVFFGAFRNVRISGKHLIARWTDISAYLVM